MELKDKHLSVRMKGKAVKELQALLKKLGYSVSANEVKKLYFGKSTREAVDAFQHDNGINVSGVVDDTTVRALERQSKNKNKKQKRELKTPLAKKKPDPKTPPTTDPRLATLTVSGQVTNEAGAVMPGMLVQVCDVDMRSREQLGEGITDKSGIYQISYSDEQYADAEYKTADLVAEVYNKLGVLLGESEILFNVPAGVIRLDVVVTDKPISEPAEYEYISNMLLPLLKGIAHADLTDHDIQFLAGETGIDTQILNVLPQAARLSLQTDITAEFFYGLGRGMIAIDELEQILVLENRQLLNTINGAVNKKVVDKKLLSQLDDIVARIEQLRLEHGQLINYEIIIRLVNEADEKPLAAYSVHTYDLDSGAAAPDDLGGDVTDQDGTFSVALILPPQESLPGQPSATRHLDLVIMNADGEELVRQDVHAPLESEEPLTVSVAVPAIPPIPSPTIYELAETVSLELPAGLVELLAEQGIQTLADIREAGGISHLDGVPANNNSVQHLEAHARLSALSSELFTNAALIQHGYTHLQSISNISRSDFVAEMQSELGEFNSAKLYVAANAQTQYLNTVLAGARAEKANGLPSPIYGPIIEQENELPESNSPGCGCKNCDAAVSPVAYCADLLDYAVTHVKQTNAPIDLQFLGETFHQNYADMPTACRDVDREVRMARINSEILRRYLGVRPLLDQAREDQLVTAETTYRVELLTTLLNKLGTSYDEIRRAQIDADLKSSIAQRLGIAEAHITELLLDPESFTEQDLERLFGIPDTNRNPLSEGAKYGDDDNQLVQWNLQGVDWNRNTDIDGYVYLALSSSGGNYTVECYRDAEHTHLVASGDTPSPEGVVQLTMAEASGLSGSVKLGYGADTDSIRIAAVPTYICWKFQGLRSQWYAQDWPDSPPENAIPVIDPDIISLAYIKNSITTEPDSAYAIWQERYDWINSLLSSMQSLSRDMTGYEPMVLDNLGVSLSRLVELRATRDTGVNIEEELNSLNIVNGSFNALLTVYDALNNNQQILILNSEWESVFNILIQAQKRARYAEWREREQQAGINHSPDYFQLSSPEFTIPPEPEQPLPTWRTSRKAITLWEKRLETRIEQQQSVVNTLGEALDVSEKSCIGFLRDGLINVAVPGNDSFTEKSRQISSRLLIEAGANVCRKKTRVSQAIESMQQLLWSLRSGQLDESLASITLDADYFDREWKWLGTYSAWRSAMFVFLYPENLLHPAFRKWSTQTPVFRELLNELRDNTRLTPDSACRAAGRYSDYFKDVCSLRLEASVIANTAVDDGDCRTKIPKGNRDLVYLFARGGETNTVYCSRYDPNDATPYAQQYWEAVPGLENVINIVGAAVYERSSQQRHIYLFLRCSENEVQQLKYTTFDLETGTWSIEANELELPEGAMTFTGVVNQKHRNGLAPQIAVRLTNGAIYSRYMNRDGNDWEDSNWQLLVSMSKGKEFDKLHAFIEFAPNESCLFTSTSRNSKYKVYYRLISRYDDGHWRQVGNYRLNKSQKVSYVGAFSYARHEKLYVLHSTTQSNNVNYQVVNRSKENLSTSTIATFNDFDNWFKSISGLSLSAIKINDSEDADSLLDMLNLYSQGEVSYIVARGLVRILEKRFLDEKDALFPEWKYADSRVWLYTTNNKGLKLALNDLLDGGAVTVVRRSDSGELSSPTQWISGLQDFTFAYGNFQVGPEGRVAYRRDLTLDSDRFNTAISKTFNSTNLSEIPSYPLIPIRGSNLYRATILLNSEELLQAGNPTRIAPNVRSAFEISEHVSDSVLQLRRQQIKQAFEYNDGSPAAVLNYLEEAWYFVPMLIALQLQQRGYYDSALDWFRTVYDYFQPVESRKIYYGLEKEEPPQSQESEQVRYDLITGWLRDRVDPHAIALTRFNAYTRYTLLSLVNCFLQYADAEFSRDTSESVTRASKLYKYALNLLGLPELSRASNRCQELVGTLEIELGPEIEQLQEEAPEWTPILGGMITRLGTISDFTRLTAATTNIKSVFSDNSLDWSSRFAQAQTIVTQAVSNFTLPASIISVIDKKASISNRLHTALLAQPVVYKSADKIGEAAARDFAQAISLVMNTNTTALETGGIPLPWLRKTRTSVATRPASQRQLEAVTSGLDYEAEIDTRIETEVIENPVFKPVFDIEEAVDTYKYMQDEYVPAVAYQFCIPRNPLINSLRLHVEVNLFKLSNCLDISGLQRELEPYSAPVNSFSGLPTLSEIGVPETSSVRTFQPTPYRFEYLIERAKQLTGLAQQIEASYLSTLEKYDAESYGLLKARQDVQLTHAGVRLQSLRQKEARDGVKLAELQKHRSEIQYDYYDGLIVQGTIQYEDLALGFMITAASLHLLAGLANSFNFWQTGSGASAVSAYASAASTTASIFQIYADRERRMKEWQHQRKLANQEIRIGDQQIKLANDRVGIVNQEREIADLQADFAADTLQFLTSKFTSAELYAWMSDQLGNIYSYFLQQATAMARLAENQMEFERQFKTTINYIKSDYWQAPHTLREELNSGETVTDRRGLTGSAQLLKDLTQLELHAFETQDAKLQLTKNIPLAQMMPYEFQKFRETGVLEFSTPLAIFDLDFPGHYHRQIKRVRISVIALISPVESIHATLTSNGISRIARKMNGTFDEGGIIERHPESVALTSSQNATGLFELIPQNQEKLFPFEGQGVDASWTLELPKPSNHFDYSTIANVIFTIDYTALTDSYYRAQVIAKMERSFSADRAFSFRHQFADQWYDLHNPGQSQTPMAVRFKTERTDFPPNLEDITIRQIVVYFSFKNGVKQDMDITLLYWNELENEPFGGSVDLSEGKASTLSGSAVEWQNILGKSVVSEWELALPNTEAVKQLFRDEKLEDIFFVITYNAQTPPWPTLMLE